MEIHHPEGPTKSFREFLIHIGIVTIGILIALGLESIEEAAHFRHVVHEAREKFRVELDGNCRHIDLELVNDKQVTHQIDAMLADLPHLRSDPAALTRGVQRLAPSGYFFLSSRWEAALSSGAVAHMKVEEINRYSEANFLVHTYIGLQNNAEHHWDDREAFFNAHPAPTPAELTQGLEKLYLYRADVRGLSQVGEELADSIHKALQQE